MLTALPPSPVCVVFSHGGDSLSLVFLSVGWAVLLSVFLAAHLLPWSPLFYTGAVLSCTAEGFLAVLPLAMPCTVPHRSSFTVDYIAQQLGSSHYLHNAAALALLLRIRDSAALYTDQRTSCPG
jgi:hypothetical protein